MVKQNKISEAFSKTKIGKQLELNLNINLAILFCMLLFLIGFGLGAYIVTNSVYIKTGTKAIASVALSLLIVLYGFIILTILSGTKYISALMEYGQRTHKRN